MGNMALEGGDPRGNSILGTGQEKGPGDAVAAPATSGPMAHKLHDPNVYFEEYLHYAVISRNDARYEDPHHEFTFRKRKQPELSSSAEAAAQDGGINGSREQEMAATKSSTEKEIGGGGSQHSSSGVPAYTPQYLEIADDEWVNASRAARTATWGAVFYLITTDILGPFSVP